METTVSPGRVTFSFGSKKKTRHGSFTITFNRTLRLPEDGKTHGLPPGLGTFPVKLVDDYRDKVPASWREHGGVFLPVHEREALWLGFSHHRYPCAVKVAAGKINAVNGKPWHEGLAAGVEDYMVAPPQQWLDGFNSGDGFVKQFVAMAMGKGYTVEGQVTGKEEHGGIQLLVIPPKKGAIKPDVGNMLRGVGGLCMSDGGGPNSTFTSMEAEIKTSGGIINPKAVYSANTIAANSGPTDFMDQEQSRGIAVAAPLTKAAEMGLGAGGRMHQKIYPDPHGIGTWNLAAAGRLFIHIINADMYEQITGEAPPPLPREVQDYKGPWFGMNDGDQGDVAAPDELAGVKSIGEMDNQHGFEGQQNDTPIFETVTHSYPTKTHVKNGVRDGKW